MDTYTQFVCCLILGLSLLQDEELTTVVKTESYALDDQNVKGILSEVANDDSEVSSSSTLYKVMFNMIHYLLL